MLRHFRSGLLFASLMALAGLAPQMGRAQVAPVASAPEAKGLLIAFQPESTLAQRLAAVRAAGLTADTTVSSNYIASAVPMAAVGAQKATTDVAALSQPMAILAQNPVVRVVEPNYVVHRSWVPNDPSFVTQWGLRNTGQSGGVPGVDIDAVTAWDTTRGSESVIVAVIDTGVDYLHADLAGNILKDSGGKLVGYDFANNDADPMDDDGHGTHCAGTIGAVTNNGIGVAGVCPTVKIMPLKFLGADGSGDIADAIAAIDYARTHGAKVMSNSWGYEGSSSGLLLEAVKRARDAGILFVAAAGNGGDDGIGDNNDNIGQYPSDYTNDSANVIAVASSTRNDTLSTFSNYGVNSVDIAAPGDQILSTLPRKNGNATYGTYSGTSMATPHVSGAAALALAANPALTAVELKQRLRDSADRVSVFTGKVGSGRLNAAALLALDGLKIKGTITLNGSALSGVTVTAGAKQATTLSDGTYTISGLTAGTFTVTPTKSGNTFTPVSQSVTLSSVDVSNVNFTAAGAVTTYQVTGTVTANGTGLSGVTISGGGQTTTTSGTGTYTLTGLTAGTHTVTASLSGYTMTPASRSVTVGPHQSNINFTAVLNTYSLSGTVTISGQPLSGVQIALSGGQAGSATTGPNGTYSLSGLVAGNYTVTASLGGYLFSPSSRSVTVSSNQTGVDFSATATYQVTGRITRNGSSLSGVTVSGGGKTGTTDSSGNYILTGLTAGSVVVTPSKSGAVFEPASRTVSVGPDQSGINFTADTYSISGTVAVNGTGLSGVTIATTGQSVTTGSGGAYTLTNLNAGTYTLTATRSGYTFDPATRTVTVGPSRTGIGFAATLVGFSIRGTVKEGTTGLAGVTVQTSGRSTTTGADGSYTFTGLSAGSYVVRATLTGRTFTPATRTVSVGPDQTAVDFTVNPPAALQSFTLSASGVKGGKSVTGTLRLTAPAVGNVVVSLVSSLPKKGIVPATVTVPSGSSSVKFTVKTGKVKAKTAVLFTASLSSGSLTATLNIKP